MIRSINDSQQFDAEIADAGDKLVIVDFGAKWCGPCKTIAPEFNRLAMEYGSALFITVDVDECTELAIRDGIAALPTFVIYKNRVQLERIQGSAMKLLEDKIRCHLMPPDEVCCATCESTESLAGSRNRACSTAQTITCSQSLSKYSNKSSCSCKNQKPSSNDVVCKKGSTSTKSVSKDVLPQKSTPSKVQNNTASKNSRISKAP